MKLSDLRAICEAATPGPWRWGAFGSFVLVANHGRRDVILADAKTRGDDGRLQKAAPHHPNMAFIEHFNPARVLKLLAVVEAAKPFTEERYCTGFFDCTGCNLKKALRELEATE